jgi:hypothetical protein
MVMNKSLNNPFALSLSKGSAPRMGFDKLSPNGWA